MTAPADDSTSQRIVILAPTGRDAGLTQGVLHEAAINSVICEDIRCLDEALREGAGGVLVAEEALQGSGLDLLEQALAPQPPWSDLPVLLLTRYGADSATVKYVVRTCSNVTLLERPVRPPTLLSAIRAALKARDRQYQVREYLAEHERIELALREADRRKDEFLATLAHELRNPLAPIRNSLHILRLTNSGDSATDQVCEMMERQVVHLVRLVDDLMEVSRITRGKVELRLEPLDLAAVLRSAVEASRPAIDAARHQLAIALPSEPVVLMGDPVRLSQVFANLLNNATKYMAEGGQIWLTARRDGNGIEISVRDTGIGIEAEMLPQIFTMFTQVDRSRRQSQGGLGIGLTLVRSLVEMHGGQVEARSPGPGLGSEFVVRLPPSPQEAEARRSRSESRISALPHHRVLVVDDNRDTAVSLGRLLTLLGVEVRVVHDGPTALETLGVYQPTVVLLDIGMPGMDGYEVARRIREDGEHRGVTLIALTGWGQEDDRRRSSQAGFDHHLLKPADMGTVRSLFASLSEHGHSGSADGA